ncbi:hypothetical protein HK101_001835 [Irineochytrium annulatum]|nr:hypothetical protein HK101_001835 [Irineochytrium annulatum]
MLNGPKHIIALLEHLLFIHFVHLYLKDCSLFSLILRTVTQLPQSPSMVSKSFRRTVFYILGVNAIFVLSHYTNRNEPPSIIIDFFGQTSLASKPLLIANDLLIALLQLARALVIHASFSHPSSTSFPASLTSRTSRRPTDTLPPTGRQNIRGRAGGGAGGTVLGAAGGWGFGHPNGDDDAGRGRHYRGGLLMPFTAGTGGGLTLMDALGGRRTPQQRSRSPSSSTMGLGLGLGIAPLEDGGVMNDEGGDDAATRLRRLRESTGVSSVLEAVAEHPVAGAAAEDQFAGDYGLLFDEEDGVEGGGGDDAVQSRWAVVADGPIMSATTRLASLERCLILILSCAVVLLYSTRSHHAAERPPASAQGSAALIVGQGCTCACDPLGDGFDAYDAAWKAVGSPRPPASVEPAGVDIAGANVFTERRVEVTTSPRRQMLATERDVGAAAVEVEPSGWFGALVAKDVKKKHPQHPPIDPVEYWSIMVVIVVLVMLGGMFAGLTIGLMSLDETNLSILMKSGTPAEKLCAARILPIRKNSHLLLVTLLLANTVVNETLPVLFNYIDLEGYQAVLFSTALIVVFGEIIPQAVCARYGLQVGAFLAWPVRILIWLLYVIAFPIAKLLDYILGHKGAIVYRRAQLKEFVALHGEDFEGPLTREEVSILRAVLELRDKTVATIMTSITDVVMLPLEARLDRATINFLLQAGHSRVPVYNMDPEDVIGVVLVKQLVLLDPDDATPLADIRIGRLPRIRHDTPLFEILHVFEEGGSHMAVVVEELPLEEHVAGTIVTSSPLWVSTSPVLHARRYRTLGIVTLEDVIEEMIGQEIVDETDVYVDVGAKVKVARAFHEMERRLARSGFLKSCGLGGPPTGGTGGGSLPPSPITAVEDEERGLGVGRPSRPTRSSSSSAFNQETAPLLPPFPSSAALLATGGGALGPPRDYGGVASGAGAVTGPPALSPLLTPRTRGRRRQELVPAAQLIEEGANWLGSPALETAPGSSSSVMGPSGLQIQGAGVGGEAGGVVSAPVFLKIERDADGIVVDGRRFLPNELDLDNCSNRSSTSEREVEIDVEAGTINCGSLESRRGIERRNVILAGLEYRPDLATLAGTTNHQGEEPATRYSEIPEPLGNALQADLPG